MHAVTISDVGPRDGLQNEAKVLAPEARAELVNRLASAGVTHIEAASFVNSAIVPTMAGAESVMAAIKRRPGTTYSGLVLNEKGYERAIAAGTDEIHYAFAVTDAFGLRNQRQTTRQGVELGKRLISRSRADGKPISVILSVAFGCPFSGLVPTTTVLKLAESLLREQPNAIVFADTIGVGVPTQVRALVAPIVAMGARVGAHFHNTRNTGYANAIAAVEAGATILDASIGGAGGCPFAPNATGNIATEDLTYLLEGMGIQTGIELTRLVEVSQWLSVELDKQLPGLVARAGPFPSLANRNRNEDQRRGHGPDSPG